MFKIDNQTKNEAVNFATLMNLLGISESKLEIQFDKLGETVDLSIPLNDGSVCKTYAEFFNSR